MENQYSERCRRFLKADLHAHLAGCARQSTLAEMSADEALTRLADLRQRSLSDCFTIFAVTHRVMSTTADVARVMHECLQDASADNILYLELRSTPRMLTDVPALLASVHGVCNGRPCLWLPHCASVPADGVEASMAVVGYVLRPFSLESLLNRTTDPTLKSHLSWAMEHWDDALALYVSLLTAVLTSKEARALPLTVRLLLSVNRTQPLSSSSSITAVAIVWSLVRWSGKGHLGDVGEQRVVVGMDVSGDPSKGSLSQLYPLLDRARQAGLSITIHAGEVLNEEEVRRVLEWRPNRLGHMCVLPAGLLQELSVTKTPIPIELCPTSNAFTLGLRDAELDDGDVTGNAPHPLARHPTLLPLLRAGYPLAVCTDDWGVFDTTLSAELAHVCAAAGMQHGMASLQLPALVLSGFEHAFIHGESAVREGLLAKARDRAAQIASE